MPSRAFEFLSVVVIGRNEGERLRRCLASVIAMDRGPWEVEVIYVDSGSADESVSIAESMGARVVALVPERPTAALARNAGWAASRGDVILFLDGDTVVDPQFVVRCQDEFLDSKIGVVWGHRRELHPEDSVFNRVLDLDWMYRPGPAPFCGGDALIRRHVLDETRGFDPHLIAGEEPELCRRILAAGYRIEHVDVAMTGHDLDMRSFAQYWRRAMRAGHAFGEVLGRFAGTEREFWVEEVNRNRTRALALMTVAIVAVAASVYLLNLVPVIAAGMVVLGLSVRSAWKARWKSDDARTLLLYGVHSHLQQVPIFFGQVRYQLSRRRGTRTGLMEYKRP